MPVLPTTICGFWMRLEPEILVPRYFFTARPIYTEPQRPKVRFRLESHPNSVGNINLRLIYEETAGKLASGMPSPEENRARGFRPFLRAVVPRAGCRALVAEPLGDRGVGAKPAGLPLGLGIHEVAIARHTR
jgi:hypothetical protein